jgi:hypothetical protein
VVLLDQMVDQCLAFKVASKYFSRVVVLVYIPTNSVSGFLFPPHPHQHLLLVVLLMMAILTGVRWNLSVVLIRISFIARDANVQEFLTTTSALQKIIKALLHTEEDIRSFYSQTERCKKE